MPLRQPGFRRLKLRRRGASDAGGEAADWRALRSRDQGGAFVENQTRWNWAGVQFVGGLVGVTCNGLAGTTTGEMLYMLPEFFPRAGTVNRIGTRTNGTIGGTAGAFMRMGIWRESTLTSGVLSGSAYPGARVAQSSHYTLTGAANQEYEDLISVPVSAGETLWFGVVVTAVAAANQHTIVGFRRNYFAPIIGTTMSIVVGATTIASDNLTFGIGWRHAMTYTGTEEIPNPAPQSAPVVLADGAAVDTQNVPGIGFGFQAAA